MDEKESTFENLSRECKSLSEIEYIKRIMQNVLFIMAGIAAIEGIRTGENITALWVASPICTIVSLEIFVGSMNAESRERLRSLFASSSGRDLDRVFDAVFRADLDPNDFR